MAQRRDEITASKHDGWIQPFVLRPDDLRKLTEIMEKHIGPAMFNVRLADGITRHLATLVAVLELENPKGERQVISVEIEAESDSPRARATVEFEDASYATVRIGYHGPASTVEKLNVEVQDRIAGMKPWYGWLTKIHFVLAMPILLLVSAVSGIAVLLLKEGIPSDNRPLELGRAALSYLLGVGLLFLSILVGRLLDILRDRLFPLVSFAIGQGARRYKTAELIRWWVIVGPILTLVIGVLIAILLR